MIQQDEYLGGRILSGDERELFAALPGIASGLRLLILCGAHVFNNKVLKRQIDQLFPDRIVVWEVVVRHPEKYRIESIVQVVRNFRPDVMLAIGGGSVMDTAKIASVVAPNPDVTVDDAMSRRTEKMVNKIFLVAISTLFGSGSEVTPFATVFHECAKYSVDHPLVQPDVTVVMPRLGLLPPDEPAAAAYLDVLSQAIESLWAVQATDVSEYHARMCLEQLAEFRREGMTGAKLKLLAKASIYGGKAIGISRTTLAHGLSYRLTGRYGVSHGIACAIFLPEVFRWNAQVGSDCCHPRGEAWVRRRVEHIASWICGIPEPEAAVREISIIAREVRVSLSLASYGINTQGHLSDLVAHVGNQDRLGNNPRRVTPQAITQIISATAQSKD